MGNLLSVKKRRQRFAGGARPVKLLIFCLVLGGMGDVFFAKNLRDYIVAWCAEARLRIEVTTLLASVEGTDDAKKKAEIAGFRKDEIITESVNNKASGFTNFYSAMNPQKRLGTFDLYFLAPVNMDVYYGKLSRNYPLIGERDVMKIPVKEIIVYDLQALFDNVDEENVITFSVYNGEELLGTDQLDFFKNTDYDFATGIGEGKYGIMQPADVSAAPCDKEFLIQYGLTEGMYALVYVDAKQEHANDCIKEFVKRVVHKYKPLDAQPFSIVMPVGAWNVEIEQFFIDLTERYRFRLSRNGKVIRKDDGPTLDIRTDILPLPRKQFICLLKHSVREVLLTGNQSVSDVATCCPDKLLTYQVSEWTRAFGKAVGRFADTCGEKADIEWPAPSQPLADITSEWDFGKKAKTGVMYILQQFAH